MTRSTGSASPPTRCAAHVLHLDLRARGGRRSPRARPRRGGDRHRGREQAAAARPARHRTADRAVRAADAAASRWPSASSSAVRPARWPRRWRPACWPAPRPRSPTSCSGARPPPGSTTRSSCPGPGVSHVAALDRYLAGLVAYATMHRPGRAAGALAERAAGLLSACTRSCSCPRCTTTILSLLISLLVGRAIGLGVRYARGLGIARPPARDIAAALSASAPGRRHRDLR